MRADARGEAFFGHHAVDGLALLGQVDDDHADVTAPGAAGAGPLAGVAADVRDRVDPVGEDERQRLGIGLVGIMVVEFEPALLRAARQLLDAGIDRRPGAEDLEACGTGLPEGVGEASEALVADVAREAEVDAHVQVVDEEDARVREREPAFIRPLRHAESHGDLKERPGGVVAAGRLSQSASSVRPSEPASSSAPHHSKVRHGAERLEDEGRDGKTMGLVEGFKGRRATGLLMDSFIEIRNSAREPLSSDRGGSAVLLSKFG